MVSSINNANSSIQQLMAEMYQKIGQADTDDTAGLSKQELSSVDAGSDKGGSQFLQMLSSNFDKVDTDGDGQLTAKEISSAKPTGPMGPPPGMAIASSDSSGASNSIENWIDKLLKSMSEAIEKSQDKLVSENQATDKTNAADSLASADTDGTAGLSAKELSSVNTSSGAEKANFVDNLLSNFDKIDSDGNGQLSKSEIANSAPSLATSANNGSSSDFGSSLGSLSGAFIQKLLNSYQNGGLSSIASAVNLAL